MAFVLIMLRKLPVILPAFCTGMLELIGGSDKVQRLMGKALFEPFLL